MTSSHTYVLYIAQDHRDSSRFCAGSRVAMEYVEDLGGEILVQNVDVLQRKAALPEWLSGTPCLVDQTKKVAFKGTEAINRLREIIDARAHQEEEADEAARPSDEQECMVAPGQKFLVSDDGNGSLDLTSATASSEGGPAREGNVTDSDLNAYIAQRNASPAGKLMPEGE